MRYIIIILIFLLTGCATPPKRITPLKLNFIDELFKKSEIEHAQKEAERATENQKAFEARQKYVYYQHPELSKQMKECILNKQIMIGMNKEDVIASWGKPLYINKTVLENSVHEQWVYGKTLLYFTNDRLDSYQTEEH